VTQGRSGRAAPGPSRADAQEGGLKWGSKSARKLLATALAAFKDRIRHLTRRKRGMSLQAIITSLNPVIRGWGNYFVEGHVAELFEDLDKWIRMWLRSYVLGRPSMRTHINRWMTTATLHHELGLVSLVVLRRRHLSPAPG
ncbi:MAG: hypothetical protein GEU68_15200, partial [Actinobacteria bacterium]|nr:hypothetical protein [Actinomycetota bacterium]